MQVMELSQMVKQQLELNTILILPHPLSNFEIRRYFQNDVQLSFKNESKFHVYSEKKSPKIKDGEYVIFMSTNK